MAARPFMDFLREHRNGLTHDQLSDALNELVAAVTAENKSGTLTLKIGIKPSGNSGALEVSAEVKTTPPKSAPGVAIFWPSPENNLVRQDPRQMAMTLQEIPASSPHKGLAS